MPHHIVALLHGHNSPVLSIVAHSSEVKPALKVSQVLEDVRQQEVQQGPQLAQVVLQGCPCTQSVIL